MTSNANLAKPFTDNPNTTPRIPAGNICPDYSMPQYTIYKHQMIPIFAFSPTRSSQIDFLTNQDDEEPHFVLHSDAILHVVPLATGALDQGALLRQFMESQAQSVRPSGGAKGGQAPRCVFFYFYI